jgi:phenylacetate-CoA oxygenase PaaH subunit
MTKPSGVLEPYEVFRQEKEGEPMRHGGSVLAPDATLAVHYARELYGRRQESVRLWVVRRADVHELEDPDLLQPPLDRSFKKPGGYVMRDKLEAARERAGTTKPRDRKSGPPADASARPVRRRPEGGSRPPDGRRSGRDPGPQGGPDPRATER